MQLPGQMKMEKGEFFTGIIFGVDGNVNSLLVLD